MLEDPRVRRMAKTLVDYSLGVQPGWEVAISGTTASLPLIQAVCKEVIAAGASPYVMISTPWLEELLLAAGNENQLTRVNPYQLRMVEQSDAILRILSEENTRGHNNVDPARLGLLRKAGAPVGEGFMKRIEEGRPH